MSGPGALTVGTYCHGRPRALTMQAVGFLDMPGYALLRRPRHALANTTVGWWPMLLGQPCSCRSSDLKLKLIQSTFVAGKPGAQFMGPRLHGANPACVLSLEEQFAVGRYLMIAMLIPLRTIGASAPCRSFLCRDYLAGPQRV